MAEIKLKILIAQKESYFEYVNSVFALIPNLKIRSVGLSFLEKIRNIDHVQKCFMDTLVQINELECAADPTFVPDFKPAQALLDLIGAIQYQGKLLSEYESNQVMPETKVSPPRVFLPALELPTFNGTNPWEWEVFFVTYKSMIHDNNDLTNDQKVQYLVSKLGGKALSVCAGIPCIGSNYKQIYDALIERYSDKRVLASFYLDQMLNFQPLKSESVHEMNLFIDRFCAAVKGLKTLDIPDLAGFIISHIGSCKLDPETLRQYQLSIKSEKNLPTFDSLLMFVQEHSKVLSRVDCLKPSVSSSYHRSNISSGNKSKVQMTHSFVVSNSVTRSRKQCPCCNNATHPLYYCDSFKMMTTSQRHSFVKNENLCFNCLHSGHSVAQCQVQRCCNKCNLRHNTMIHFERNIASACSQDQSNVSQGSNEVVACIATQGIDVPQVSDTTVLLGTVKVNVCDCYGNMHAVRLLLDSGSQSNFLTKKLVNQLGLPLTKVRESVKGICDTASPVQGSTSFTFQSRLDPKLSFSCDAYVVNQVLDKMPTCSIDSRFLSHLSGLPMADDNFATPGPIQGIIGAHLFAMLLEPGKITGSSQSPVGLKTRLGFIVSGSVPVLQHAAPTNQ
uniref:Peptidase aspartic putative domain-containing protein n=1 Tax=Cacopsylla melanoneura TaxID=428564 RepID=A0A8D8YFY3_9HEMI